MSLPVGGLGTSLPEPLGSDVSRRPAARPDTDPGPTRHQPAAGTAGTYTAREGATSPSHGVDPALWGLLAAEERTFYLRNSITSPATYGPGAASPGASPPGARAGGRLDVRA